jgi:uncharacterized membrane protein
MTSVGDLSEISIVASRTVLSFFLNRELTTHTCNSASKKPSKT